MKKFTFSVGLFLLTLFFTACNEEQETLAGGDELPVNSKTFLADYFADESIVSIEQGTDNYQVYYPSYKVQFDTEGAWKQLDGKRVAGYYKSVPNAFINREIPQAIRDWVTTNYPNAYIVDIEREYKNRVFIGYEIELSNGIDDLFFDTQGNFVSGPTPNISALPQAARTFLTTYFANDALISQKRDGGDYEVILTSGIEIEFNSQGIWKNVDGKFNNGKYTALPTTFLTAELPANLLTFVSTNYPGKSIIEVEKEFKYNTHTGYDIELNNTNVDLDFDLQGNILNGGGTSNPGSSILPETAKTFLSTYFANDALYKQKRDDDGDYEVTLTSGIEIEFNSQGVWKNVDGNFDGGRYSALPTTFLNAELPSNLLTFVNTNYPGRVVIEVDKEFKYNSLVGYEIELNGKIEVKFDTNGNVLGGGGNSGTTELPQTAKDFMNTHFSGSSYTTKLDDGEYKVYVGYYKIEFDRQGNWTQIDGETGNRKTALPASILALQPLNTINAYVNSRYSGRYIINIEKDYKRGVTYYEVELNNSVDLIFDAQGSFLRRD